jgi:hypothetical protein
VYNPVAIPTTWSDRSARCCFTSIGVRTFPTVIAAPSTTVPTKNHVAAGNNRSTVATASTAIARTVVRSLPIRRPTPAATADSPPKHSTGTVVSSPAAPRDSPRSARMSGSRGDTAAMPDRRLTATSTTGGSTKVSLRPVCVVEVTDDLRTGTDRRSPAR